MAVAGAVWLPVLPDMSMFNRAVASSARLSLGKAGTTAGTQYGSSLARAAKSSMSRLGTDTTGVLKAAARDAALAVDKAYAKVTAAEKRAAGAADQVAAAEKRAADATGRLTVAQLKLVEAENRGNLAGHAAAVERISKAQRDLQISTGHVTKAERDLQASTNATRLATTELSDAQGRAAAKTDEVALASTRAGSRFGKFTTGAAAGATRLGSHVGGLAKQAAGLGGIFAGFELAHFAGESIKSAMGFQRGTQILQTAAGELPKNLALVRSGLMKISSDTGTSLDQMTTGMYTVEKAGIRGSKGLAIMRAAAKGAKDEGADLGVVTNALTTIMTTSNGHITNASKAMNALMVAAGHSKTSLQDFSTSLSSVLPIASKLHVPFSQVAGAISGMTAQGVSAEQATQNLGHTLTALAAPNRQASLYMHGFGLSSADVRDKLGKRGLQGTIEYLSNAIKTKMAPATREANALLKTMPASARALFDSLRTGTITVSRFNTDVGHLKGVTQAQKAQLLGTVPAATGYTQALAKMTGGIVGMRTSLELLGPSSKIVSRTTQDVAHAVNSTKDFDTKWGITKKTTQNALAIARASFSNLGVTLATKVLPAIAMGAAGFANFVQSISPFVKANRSWLQPLAIGFGVAATAVGLYVGAVKVAALATKAWAVVQALLNGTMAANPIGLAVLAIAGLSAGAIYAYKHFATFRRVVDAAWSGIKTATAATVGWITKSAIPWLVNAFGAVKSVTVAVGGWFATAWADVTSVTKAGLGFLRRHWGLIVSIIGGPVGLVAVQVIKHFGRIEAVAKAVFGGVRAAAHGLAVAWQAVASVFVTVWDAVLYPVFELIGAIARKVFIVEVGGTIRGLRAVWADAVRRMVAVWDGVLHPMLLGVQAGWNTLWTKGIRPVLSAIGNAWSAMVSSISGWWHRTLSAVFSAVGAAVSYLHRHVVRPELAGISSAWSLLARTLRAVWRGAISPVFDVLGSTVRGLHKIFSTAVSGIGTAWGKLEALAKAPIRFVVDTVLNNGLIKAFNVLAGAFGTKRIPPIPLPKGFSVGGPIPGRSPSPTADNIPIMATAGEFVVRHASAQRVKRERPGALEYLNATGILPRFAAGGPVGGAPTPTYDGHKLAYSGVEYYRPWMAAALVAAARVLQGRGWAALENPAFGPVHRVHDPHSLHYVGQAVDLSRGGMAGADQVAQSLMGAGFGVKWRAPGHFNHIHTDTSMFNEINGSRLTPITGSGGGGGKGGGGLGGLLSGLNPLKKLTDAMAGLAHLASTPFGAMVAGAGHKILSAALSFAKAHFNPLSGLPGGLKKVGGGVRNPLGGGNVNRWASLVGATLNQLGLGGTPSHVNAWLSQIATESGGDPNAIQQVHDVNWPNNRARGLVQVIPPTFRQYALPGYNTNIVDPASNLLAGENYAKHRYGDRMWGVVGQGHGYAGGGFVKPTVYDQGGPLKPGYTLALNNTGRTETVTPRPDGPMEIRGRLEMVGSEAVITGVITKVATAAAGRR